MTGILSSVIGSTVKPIATGGTLRSDGTYYYRTFTSNGTFTVSNKALDVSVFVVSGGGGGFGGYQRYETCFQTCFYCDDWGCYPYQCAPFPCNPYSVYSGAGAGSTYNISNLTQPIGNATITIGAGGSGGGGAGIVIGTDGSASSYVRNPDINITTGAGGRGAQYLGGSNATYTKSSGLGGAGATSKTDSNIGGSGYTDITYSASSTIYGVGGSSTVTTNSAAAANTGNGGKGGYGDHAANIVNGGSGIVVIRYLKTAVGNNG